MEAVKLAPANFEAIFGLARAFFRNGDYSKALQAAEDAMRLSPANRDVQSFMQDLRRR
jgi:cytochrome c-type biogenesis protein CcmH/NrfG